MINVKEYVSQFDITGNYLNSAPCGNGHINDTYIVYTDAGRAYILQKINNYVFKNVERLMDNIQKVTSFIEQTTVAEGGDPRRETMKIITAKDGKLYFKDQEGKYWRTYTCIENAISFDTVDNPKVFYETGKAFGTFQRRLAKFDAGELFETITHFHDTPYRYNTFLTSIAKDEKKRVKEVKKEIAFVSERAAKFGKIERLLAEERIPRRVTHNDTKLNNVMFDSESKQALAVIDLDTVMPSTLLYDFGDAIRYGCNTATEETKDLDLVHFSINLFEVFARGFFDGIGKMTDLEAELLPFASWLMTMECGMRFLTDYIDGDVYFRTTAPGMNLDRARTQFKLAREMEEQMPRMQEIISEVSKLH